MIETLELIENGLLGFRAALIGLVGVLGINGLLKATAVTDGLSVDDLRAAGSRGASVFERIRARGGAGPCTDGECKEESEKQFA